MASAGRRDVLLAGAYGQGNPGDEALLEAFVRALGAEQLVVTSSDPRATTDRWGCAAIPPTGPAVLARLGGTRHLVIGGGTVFKTLHPSTRRPANGLLRRAWALTVAAKLRGATVSLVGVGAADLRGSQARRLATHLVRVSDLLVLRDEESAAVLSEAGARPPFRVAADPAWSLFDSAGRPVPAPVDQAARDTTVVALSHLASTVSEREFADRVAQALDRVLVDDPVALQPWQQHAQGHDVALAQEVATRLDGRVSILDPPTDLHDAVDVFARCRLVVGLRFHALIAAAVAGTPFVAVTHEPKLAALARRLGQLGVPAHAGPAVLARAITTSREAPPPSTVAVRGEQIRAAEAFRLLNLLLTDGRAEERATITGLPLSAGEGLW